MLLRLPDLIGLSPWHRHSDHGPFALEILSRHAGINRKCI
jgi:hypothetical protein